MGWNIIRGNHAWQPRSSSPQRREFVLFVLKIKLLFLFQSKFFFYQVSNSRLFGKLERGCLAWLPRVVASRGYHE